MDINYSRDTINVKAVKDVESGEHLPPRYCNTSVDHYHHHLKFHLIDRKPKSRDVATMTGALMIAERNRDGIHQFAHGFANTTSTGESGIHLDDETVFFLRFSRAAGPYPPRDATTELFLMTTESTLLITGAGGKIDTVDPESSCCLIKIHEESSPPALSRASRIRSALPVLLRCNIDEEKRNICAALP